MTEKLVLVVDDDFNFHQSIGFLTGIAFPVKFISAMSLKEAERLFREHYAKLDAILVDGCVESKQCDTLPLIQHFKESRFRGPIIGISNARHLRAAMHKAGATDFCGKHEIRRTLEELLFPPEVKKRVARR